MSAFGRFKTLVFAVVAFFGGSIGWAAASGFLAGVGDMVGLVFSASAWLAPAPLVGLLAAGYVAGVFD